jgi:hypothetical protein
MDGHDLPDSIHAQVVHKLYNSRGRASHVTGTIASDGRLDVAAQMHLAQERVDTVLLSGRAQVVHERHSDRGGQLIVCH